MDAKGKKTVFLLGDSMLRDVNGYGHSQLKKIQVYKLKKYK